MESNDHIFLFSCGVYIASKTDYIKNIKILRSSTQEQGNFLRKNPHKP